ncbi:MAG: glucose-1-phosphate adenylyltransferase [Candidatus Eremiobacteraeota bacterium]|nr:glucose-1-phosphate adenylyltransferase [Candidatus Eremiobacteraeota bacterium]
MVQSVQPRFVSLLTKATLALVLAGGRGSRLMQLTEWRAKPAVPFGGKFRIIDFPLSNCINSGIRRVGVITQYKAHSLIRHLQRGWSFLHGEFGEEIELMPASQRIEESWYRGTADAVYQNLDIIRAHRPEYVLVLAGDHIYKMDYGKMLVDHVSAKADVTLGAVAVPVAAAAGLGTMTADAYGRITSFAEKSASPAAIPGRPDMTLASMGIYVFNASFLYEELAADLARSDSTHDFGRDLIPALVTRCKVVAHPFANSCVGTREGEEPYWRDVGTVDAYWEANNDLISILPSLNLYDASWPIWTYQEQVPPAKFVLDQEGRRGSATDSLVSGGSIISGSSVRRSLIFTSVRAHSYSKVEDCVILPNVTINRHCRLRRAVVDKLCNVPEGMVVGEDPLEDARRFYRTEKGITLITPEMLGQQVHHAG